MTLSPAPSDALAQLATKLLAVERRLDAGQLEKWIKATEILEQEDPGEPWTLSPEELFELPALAKHAWPPNEPSSEAAFVAAVRALQVLDNWHAPLFPRAGQAYEILDAHEAALDRLNEAHRLGEDAEGFIIPALAWNRDVDEIVEVHLEALRVLPRDVYDEPKPASILRQMLDYTAYLPKTLNIENADQPGLFDGRQVRINYRTQISAPASDRDLNSPIRLGIAPLVETRHDACFQVVGNTYNITPVYPKERLARVIDQALRRDVELLLFPEMSVNMSHLPFLAEEVLKAYVEYGGSIGKTPALRYLMAGATGPSDEGRHQNFVVVLDRFGREVMRQHKLHRWNLEPHHIDRYDLHAEVGPSRRLEEDIEPARELTLLDLPDLGRVIHLICADSSFNTPADWLLAHCRTDWLHAPIMDQSTRVAAFDQTSQWILKRAYRAACLGHNRVVVTNSMAITCRANDANQADPSKHRYILPDVTVGLLFDAMTPAIRYDRVATPIPCADDSLHVVDWRPDWPAFLEKE